MSVILPEYSPDLDPGFIDQINCSFASQVYARFAERKHGVSACIANEFDRYLIKKRWLDLTLILDPYVAPVVVEDVEPSFPDPDDCFAVFDLNVVIDAPDMACEAVEDLSVVLQYQS